MESPFYFEFLKYKVVEIKIGTAILILKNYTISYIIRYIYIYE